MSHGSYSVCFRRTHTTDRIDIAHRSRCQLRRVPCPSILHKTPSWHGCSGTTRRSRLFICGIPLYKVCWFSLWVIMSAYCRSSVFSSRVSFRSNCCFRVLLFAKLLSRSIAVSKRKRVGVCVRCKGVIGELLWAPRKSLGRWVVCRCAKEIQLEMSATSQKVFAHLFTRPTVRMVSIVIPTTQIIAQYTTYRTDAPLLPPTRTGTPTPTPPSTDFQPARPP